MALGHVPLPPYIASQRAGRPRDRIDYQTVLRIEKAPLRRRRRGSTSLPN